MSTSERNDGAVPVNPWAECEHTVRALWDYLDGELDRPAMETIDRHLAACELCMEHVRFERALMNSLHALRREHDDAEALRAHVLNALKDAGWKP